MMPLISILTDINKSKTLKDQIAAAAFYQMISNLIYFMREEMLSLLQILAVREYLSRGISNPFTI